jgi:hypothetical protein
MITPNRRFHKAGTVLGHWLATPYLGPWLFREVQAKTAAFCGVPFASHFTVGLGGQDNNNHSQ